jgi:hypothetical protein
MWEASFCVWLESGWKDRLSTPPCAFGLCAVAAPPAVEKAADGLAEPSGPSTALSQSKASPTSESDHSSVSYNLDGMRVASCGALRVV